MKHILKNKRKKELTYLKIVSLMSPQNLKNNTSLEISLNVVNISRDSNKTKPNIIENLKTSSLGFLREKYSYIIMTIWPPSKIGIGSKLTNPIPVEIIATKDTKDKRPEFIESETA